MKKKYIYSMGIVVILIVAILLMYFSKRDITLKPSAFSQLPNWQSANVKKSLSAFRLSCKTFLKQDPEKWVGSEHLAIQVKDWQPACRAAMQINSVTKQNAKEFFNTWFTPVEFYQGKPLTGLFTGYYMPLLHGSLTKTKQFNVPIYGLPNNLVTANLGLFKPDLNNRRIVGRIVGNKMVPFYTREEINTGAIDKVAPTLLWLDNPMDRVFLEIEGSGVIELVDGKRIYVGYAGENGAPYTSIASVLIQKGVLTKNNASSQNIREYLNDHPQEIDDVLNQNKSFIFFSQLKTHAAMGAQGVALTPGVSLAVDPKWVPYGTPVWLSTSVPNEELKNNQPFNRLMVAQDTGGAIRGTVRGDTYWGSGKKATYIANHMQAQGRYWLLLPQHIAAALHE